MFNAFHLNFLRNAQVFLENVFALNSPGKSFTYCAAMTNDISKENSKDVLEVIVGQIQNDYDIRGVNAGLRSNKSRLTELKSALRCGGSSSEIRMRKRWPVG